MFEKIVLATDLSPAWDEIVACASELKALGCSRVILTHVITVKFVGGLEVILRDEAQPKLEAQRRGGIVALQLERLSLASVRSLGGAFARPATRFALVAAVTTAAYTIWDKYAIRQMEPFAYMYTYTVIVALAYGAWVRRRVSAEERASTWRQHRWAIVAIGILNTLSYRLTLVALRDDTSSLVIGLRQLSIVFGVLLGAALLGERLTPPRVLGVAMIGIGCLTIALG